MNVLLISVLLAIGGQAPAAPQVVTLKAADETLLKATYYPASRPGPGIILLHACNQDRSAWSGFAAEAAARGYHVLALDYRGYGESGGQRFQKFQEQQPVIDTKWPGDVDAAFTWLTGQAGVDKARIAAAGASCGVNQSVQLARRHPEVRTVVLLSGTVTPAGRDYLRRTPSIPLLAAASHDDGDAVDALRWTLGWSRNPANKLIEYKAAGHGTDMFAVEQGLQPAILDWLDTHLRNASTAPATAPASYSATPVEEFWTALNRQGGVARAREIFASTRGRTPEVLLFPETELNLFGYQLLQEGNAKDAVIVFEMNVQAYPRSANTYDSLSDAYLALGNRDEALRYAEKALEMLATDTRATAEFREAVRQSAQKKVDDLKKR